MRFSNPQTRRPSIDISPMVDVVFLLIIFFTVSTTFRDGTGLPIDLPSAGSAQAQTSGPVEVSIATDGRINIGGQTFASIDELKPSLETALAESDLKRVVIRGDKKASYETIIGVLDLSRSLNAEGVTLSTHRTSDEGN